MASLIAIFMNEGSDDQGEAIGYIDLFDPNLGHTTAAADFDDSGFMTNRRH